MFLVGYYCTIFCEKLQEKVRLFLWQYFALLYKKYFEIEERKLPMNTQALFEEYREGILECIHYGTVCVVNSQGILASAGDTDWLCFYRSASKPLQSLPVLLHGLDKKYL